LKLIHKVCFIGERSSTEYALKEELAMLTTEESGTQLLWVSEEVEKRGKKLEGT